MDDRLSRLESKVADLTSVIDKLERRLNVLEARGTAGAVEGGAVTDSLREAVEGLSPSRPDLVGVLALIGRLFIVLGGAFLLRALTESGRLVPAVGIGAGLAYAALWIVAADRAAEARRKLAADFHGIATALIAFPLVWEATSKFKFLSPWASAGVLALLVAVCVGIAWRRRLQTLAWVAVAGALPSALALIAGTGEVVPYLIVVLALGAATLWMGYSLDWLFLRWPVAATADLIVFGLTLRALSARPQEPAGVVIAVQLLLLASYLVSIAVRTLVRGRNVIPFEVIQTLAALALGFGGAIAVAVRSGIGVQGLGVASLVFAAASYGVTFAFIDRLEHRGRNVYFYAFLAIVFMLAGTDLVLGETMNTATWSVLGVVTAWLWARYGRLALGLHAGLYLLAAAIVSQAITYGAGAFFGSAGSWQVPSSAMLIVIGAGLASAWVVSTGLAGSSSGYSRIPRMAIILVLVWVAGSTIVGTLAPAVGGTTAGGVDPGALATIRTGVLAVSALVVAWIGSRARFIEWGWLVYPILIVAGFKMVLEDFMTSRPGALAIALALYGASLVFAPRIRRPRQQNLSSRAGAATLQ